MLRLKFTHEHTMVLQQYEILASVVSQALGGGQKKPAVVYQPKNVDEAEAMLKAVLG